VAQTGEIPELDGLDPERLYVFWDVVLTTDAGENAIRDVFIFVEDESEVRIDLIDDGAGGDDGYKKIGDILVERGDLSREALEEILEKQKRFGELCIREGLLQPDQVEAALVEQEHIRRLRKSRVEPGRTSVRVPAGKLDTLIDMVGEMVTVQARLSQTVAGLARTPEGAALAAVAEEIERLTAGLRDETMSLRMLPIGSTFSRFRRLVRDLSAELGKEVELVTDGAETELDKTVIERLNDPLVHLIRNSIDHGIEPPAVRRAAGKPAAGRIHLSAAHSGASVLIRIRDDGAGLDAEKIRARAVERGLAAPDAELPESEVFSFIFAPGFSTAREVTSVSGRGVGMDVVKKAVESLRGTIEVQSRKGEGTEIVLKLPLTLAIIEALLTRVAGEHFVLSLASVEECIPLTREDVARVRGRRIVNVRGAVVPYLSLREHFRLGGEPPEIQQVVVTDMDGHRIGFAVDAVIGEHQTVIKPLGRVYRNIEGISGATILGDGSVALILDLYALARRAELEERAGA